MAISRFLFVPFLVLEAAASAAPLVNRYACPIDKPQKVYGETVPTLGVTLDKDETWTPDNVYLVFGRFSLNKKLTIKAGIVVCFDFEATPPKDGEPHPGEISVSDGGAIETQGTADKHVVFTVRTDGTGEQLYWSGVSTNGISPLKLVYTDLYNPGISSGGYPIDVLNDNNHGPPVDLENVVIYSTQRKGLRLWNHKGFTASSRVVVNNFAEEYQKVDYLMNYPVLHMNSHGVGTLTADTFRVGDSVLPTVKYVELDGIPTTNVGTDVTLHKLQKGLAFYFPPGFSMAADAHAPNKLTIDPGVVVAMGGPLTPGAPFGSGGKTSFIAVGTKADPILFTSNAPLDGREPAPGDWDGLMFYWQNLGADSKIDNAIFEYGGGGTANPVYSCPDKSNASEFTGEIVYETPLSGNDFPGISITNTIFRKSKGNAIRGNCGAGGHLTGDYTKPEYHNVFQDFDDADRPAQTRCSVCN
jgi:hypothetical protein